MVMVAVHTLQRIQRLHRLGFRLLVLLVLVLLLLLLVVVLVMLLLLLMLVVVCHMHVRWRECATHVRALGTQMR